MIFAKFDLHKKDECLLMNRAKEMCFLREKIIYIFFFGLPSECVLVFAYLTSFLLFCFRTFHLNLQRCISKMDLAM